MTQNIDQNEVNKFAEIAANWWDPTGDFKPLHVINPLRADYIDQKLSVNDMRTTFLVKNRDGKDMVNTQRHILAKNYVRYVGDPILAIIAESLEIAESVAENIVINYESGNLDIFINGVQCI